MTVLDTAVDPRTAAYLEHRGVALERLARLEEALEQARAGGGEKAVTRHHARGKLLPRERVEMLLDQDSPFLELSPVAAWGTEFPVGAGVVTGIGVVEGVECLVIATDPTVDRNPVDPYPLEKIRRAARIAAVNRLPVVNLVESGDAAPGGPPPGGGLARDLSRLAADRVPTVCVAFGITSGDIAYLPALSDYTIMVGGHAKMLTIHPQPVRGTNGRSTPSVRSAPSVPVVGVSGPADHLAEDERDGLRLARQCVRRLNWRKHGPHPRTFPPEPPKYDPEDLLAIAGGTSADDPREVLARILDGSDFDEFKPTLGTALVAGWGELHGYPVGVLAGTGDRYTVAEAQKAVHFIQLANATATSLLLLSPAFGSAEIEALAHSTVPHLAVGSGRHGEPRFVFSWPGEKPAAGDDDGVIDPRDTRTVLGLCLSAAHSAAVEGAGHMGVFRPGKVDQ